MPLSPISDDREDKRKTINLLTQPQFIEVDALLNRFSVRSKIERTFAYCLRFGSRVNRPCKTSLAIPEVELHCALKVLNRSVQNTVFAEQIHLLKNNKMLSKPFCRLFPFILVDDILRVGGGMLKFNLTFETKHPALLPRQHRLSELLIADIHLRFLHPGINSTMYLLQQQVWMLGAR